MYSFHLFVEVGEDSIWDKLVVACFHERSFLVAKVANFFLSIE